MISDIDVESRVALLVILRSIVISFTAFFNYDTIGLGAESLRNSRCNVQTGVFF